MCACIRMYVCVCVCVCACVCERVNVDVYAYIHRFSLHMPAACNEKCQRRVTKNDSFAPSLEFCLRLQCLCSRPRYCHKHTFSLPHTNEHLSVVDSPLCIALPHNLSHRQGGERLTSCTPPHTLCLVTFFIFVCSVVWERST